MLTLHLHVYCLVRAHEQFNLQGGHPSRHVIINQREIYSRADQVLSDRRGADFPEGVHWCVTKEAAQVRIFELIVLIDFGLKRSL